MMQQTIEDCTNLRRRVMYSFFGIMLLSLLCSCQRAGVSTNSQGGVMDVVLDPASPRSRLLDQLSLSTTRSSDLVKTIANNRHGVVVADANPQAVRSLVDHAQVVQAFTDRGGWLMLWGLTPDGLTDFNRLVGVEHLIRPFTVEAVRLPRRADPLLAGVSPFDLIMMKGCGMQNIPLRDGEVWSYVLDGEDIAPFSRIPPSSYWRSGSNPVPGDDTYPPNLVNGMDDSWQLGFTIPTDSPGHLTWTFAFPRPETVTRFSLTPDPLYHRINRIRLSFPGSNAAPIERDIVCDELIRQDIELPGIRAIGVTLEILGMSDSPVPVTGIRNLWIQVQRSDEFRRKVIPLLSIGVLNKYPMGRGGIILNQMRIEEGGNPVNLRQQQSILDTLLHNLLVLAPAPEQPQPTLAPVNDAVDVDAWVQPGEIDDTQAIRRAIATAKRLKLPCVRFAARSYFSNTAIQEQGAGDLRLQGTLGADGRPATKLLFIIPSRCDGAPNFPNMVSGVTIQDLLLRY
jgi:hypothetical protein